MEVTGELCEQLIAEGVPGIHFYSLNRSTATTELVDRLGLAAHRARRPGGDHGGDRRRGPGRPVGAQQAMTAVPAPVPTHPGGTAVV